MWFFLSYIGYKKIIAVDVKIETGHFVVFLGAKSKGRDWNISFLSWFFGWFGKETSLVDLNIPKHGPCVNYAQENVGTRLRVALKVSRVLGCWGGPWKALKSVKKHQIDLLWSGIPNDKLFNWIFWVFHEISALRTLNFWRKFPRFEPLSIQKIHPHTKPINSSP